MDKRRKQKKTSIVIVLDNIRSCHNIGSIFRTADAFLIQSIYLCGITATPPHKEIHKTALGAEDTVDWSYIEQTKEAIQALQIRGYKVIAVEQVKHSTMLFDFRPQRHEKIALVFGNEVKGIHTEIIDSCDTCVEIPQYGTKQSLNISISAGIVLWDFFCKMKQPSHLLHTRE
jgi:23S rRNA (guanosine2251-2'-O)-methyltransferase